MFFCFLFSALGTVFAPPRPSPGTSPCHFCYKTRRFFNDSISLLKGAHDPPLGAKVALGTPTGPPSALNSRPRAPPELGQKSPGGVQDASRPQKNRSGDDPFPSLPAFLAFLKTSPNPRREQHFHLKEGPREGSGICRTHASAFPPLLRPPAAVVAPRSRAAACLWGVFFGPWAHSGHPRTTESAPWPPLQAPQTP